MSFGKDLADEALAWRILGGMPSKKQLEVEAMPLVEFLELIANLDFNITALVLEGEGKNAYGIRAREQVLRKHIERLKGGKTLYEKISEGEPV